MKRAMGAFALLTILAVPAPAPAASTPANTQAVPAPTVADPLAGLTRPGDRQRLSDEATVTRWAHASDAYPIRSAPRTGARTVATLRYLTEDEQPEVYLVLDARLDGKGAPWLHIRVPMRPNGRTGWVPADRMSALYVVRTRLTIDVRRRTATLLKDGKQVWSSPVGVGRQGTPTPQGRFWIRELLQGGGGAYGPWAFGTAGYSRLSDWPGGGVIGIHGTNQPELIPGAPSHGCVRVPNAAIRRLKALMPIGTPVRIVG